VSIQRLKGELLDRRKSRQLFSKNSLEEFSDLDSNLFIRVRDLPSTAGLTPLFVTRDSSEVFDTDHPRIDQWYLLQLDESQTSASFMEMYLKEEVGQISMPRSMLSASEYKEFFAAWRVWIPSLDKQQQLTRIEVEIRTQLSSYSELRTELWKKIEPESIEIAMAPEIRNTESFQEVTFKSWVETLPFPLATALWAYIAEEHGDKGTQVQQLDWFFETFNAFLGVVFLSVLNSDSDLMSGYWPEIRNKLNGTAPLQKPTQGTWLTIIEKLSKAIRSDLDDSEKQAQWLEAFACQEPELLRAITSKKLVSVLRDANHFRNRWRGHGAPPSDAELDSRGTQYLELLVQVRELLADKWQSQPLVFAHSNDFEDDDRYTNSVDIAMGALVPLKKTQMDLVKPLKKRTFNLINPVTRNKLELLPFIQDGMPVGEQPMGVYLYNGVAKKSHTCSFLSCSHPGNTMGEISFESLKVAELVNEFDKLVD
jgi:hypothetical protein